MKVNFKGAGENVITFIADSSVTAEGQPVKVTSNGTVTKCGANDLFCGITVGVRDGYAAVQIGGYAVFPAAEQITVGYQKLAATAAGKAAVNNSGRELLVVDSTATEVGVIL